MRVAALASLLFVCELAPSPPPPASPDDATDNEPQAHCVDRCHRWYAKQYASPPPAGWCKSECADNPGWKFSDPDSRTVLD